MYKTKRLVENIVIYEFNLYCWLSCEEQMHQILIQSQIEVFHAQSQVDLHPTEVMGNIYAQVILWICILGCWAADPGGESTERTGCNMWCAAEVMKRCICWRRPYLLPSSSLLEEILSQYEREGQMLSNNVKTQPSEQFHSSLHLRRWEGKQSLFIHSWVNYLSLSYMGTDKIFEIEKPQNVVMIETDKHSHVQSPDFLLLFHCVFEVLREWVKSQRTVFNFCTFSESKAGDKICWTGFREEYALTTHYTATKYCPGSRCLVFPWNLLLSSQSSCVKPVRNKISCGSVSCAAYKYGLITLQRSWWDRCYRCIPPECWSTYWWFADCLHSFHSSVLWPFPVGSICQLESGSLHSGAPPACGAHALYPLLLSWLHTSK